MLEPKYPPRTQAEPWESQELLKDEENAVSRDAQRSSPVKKKKTMTLCLKD